MMASPGSDIDVALEELESRLERLRSLYEQYFIGMEKIEPSIPRQDVDRRIYALRKVQIRNTAKRFKLQNIIQRYNAFQQYWVRVCREIENGTYHRHVARAQSRFGDVPLTAAARRKARLPAHSNAEERPPNVEPKARATRSAEEDLQTLLGEDPELALEQALAAADQIVIKPAVAVTPLATNENVGEARPIVATTPPRPASTRAKKQPAASLAPAPGQLVIEPAQPPGKSLEGASKVLEAVAATASARPVPPPRPPAKNRPPTPEPSAPAVPVPARAPADTLLRPAVDSAGLIAGAGSKRAEAKPVAGPIRAEPVSAAAVQPVAPAPPVGEGARAVPVVAPAVAAPPPGAPTGKGRRSAAPPRRSAAPAAKTGKVKEPHLDSWAALRVPAVARRGANASADVPPNPIAAARAPDAVSSAKGAEKSALGVAQPLGPGDTPLAPPGGRASAQAVGEELSKAPRQPAPARPGGVVARATHEPGLPSVTAQAINTAVSAPSRPREPAQHAPARALVNSPSASTPKPVDAGPPAPPARVPSTRAAAAGTPVKVRPADASVIRAGAAAPSARVEPATAIVSRAGAAAPPAKVAALATPSAAEAVPAKVVAAPTASRAGAAVPSTKVAAIATVGRAEPGPAAPAAVELEASSRGQRPHVPVGSEEPASAQARAAAAGGRAAAERAVEARAHAQTAASSRLDEQRLSQLHGSLVAERRRLNQPGKVSKEALATSLRDTETKLRKQYADKSIDFHVVVKDGKAMVKPIVG